MTVDLYETLGVDRGARAADIKRAFRKKAKAAHPDVGGNADEFDRVNKAYLVLIDPDRRSEYDRTGNTSEKVDNSHVEALTIVRQMMDQIIDQVGERVEIDVVAKMCDAMDARSAEIKRDIEKRRAQVVRLSRFAGKFRKDQGENLLRKMIEAKIAGVKRGIESGEKAMVGIAKARALLEGYSFDADPVEASTYWPMSRAAFTTSTAA